MFSAAPASFGASTLSGLSGAGALATGAATGGGFGSALIGALGGPVGAIGAGVSLLGSLAQGFGGARAAEEAKKQLEEQRRYQVGASMYAQEFPRFLDWRDTKREIALTNSPAFRQSEAFQARQETFPAFAGKYGPAFARRFAGSYYG